MGESNDPRGEIALKMKLFLICLGTALAGLAIAGCGGDDNETTPAAGAQSAGGQTVNVSETEYKLDPSDPTVQPGTVSFKATNDGNVDHNLEVEGPQGEQELEQDLAPGESGTLTVDLSKPGKYEFYCPIDGHRERGMEGEITVTAEGNAGGAGTGGGSAAAGGSGDSAGGGGGSYGY
jgi:uncharacterized cupredoxin-like copper-binding protein